MAVREGRWDCQYCGTMGILGRHTVCTSCAKSRPEGTKFYLADDAPVVTEGQQLKEAQLGADWICPYCASSNRGIGRRVGIVGRHERGKARSSRRKHTRWGKHRAVGIWIWRRWRGR